MEESNSPSVHNPGPASRPTGNQPSNPVVRGGSSTAAIENFKIKNCNLVWHFRCRAGYGGSSTSPNDYNTLFLSYLRSAGYNDCQHALADWQDWPHSTWDNAKSVSSSSLSSHPSETGDELADEVRQQAPDSSISATTVKGWAFSLLPL